MQFKFQLGDRAEYPQSCVEQSEAALRVTDTPAQ